MEMTSYVERRFVISNQQGLHLRPASMLAKTAVGFDSTITVCCKGSKAEAKSVLSMILLEASYGNEVTIIAKGHDAVNAITKISELFKVGFR
jgi:phosphotransferase system HPr (HPr) family protein